MFAPTVLLASKSGYFGNMARWLFNRLPQILTAMVFIACWTMQVCAQPMPHAAAQAANAHVHHQMGDHGHHGAPSQQADPECEDNALCGAPLVLSDAPELDLPVVLPEAPKTDLKALRQTAAKTPALDPHRPRPPPRPTPVQLHAVQLN